jgi:hypothetical protein
MKILKTDIVCKPNASLFSVIVVIMKDYGSKKLPGNHPATYL